MGGIESKVQALRQQVVQVFEPAEGQEAATLEHVNAAAENLAQHITTLPPAGSAELVGITDEFRSELDGLRGQVQSIVDQAQVSVGESTDAHTATLEEAKAEAAQLATRLTETDSAIEELKTKVDEFIATREQEATTATNSAKSQFDSQLNSAKERLEQVVLDAANRFEEEEQREKASHAELIEQQSEAGAEHIARIEDLKEQAERLVGAVGRTGLSGGFQQWAETERQQAERMRTIAIAMGIAAALIGLVLVGIRVWWAEDHDGTDLPLTVGALAVPAALGTVAVYAGKESSRHRRNQVIARRTEIELASFAPFLAELDDDRQAELTAMFAAVFFGQATAHMTSGGKGDENAPEPLVRELLSKIAERMPEWFKKPPPADG